MVILGGRIFLVFANTSAVETENYLKKDYTTKIKVLMIILLYEDGKHARQYSSQYCTVPLKSMTCC